MSDPIPNVSILEDAYVVSHLVHEDPKKFPVMEMFGPTIQGEGAVAGNVSYFIRFGGCGYRCSWCDSMHAVDPQQVKKNARWLTADEIVAEMKVLIGDQHKGEDPKPLPTSGSNAGYITLTGGDPCLWNLDGLVSKLVWLSGLGVTVETQGDRLPDWLRWVDIVTISPKPPSSGMHLRTKWEHLLNFYQSSGKELNFKVVCFTEEDIQFAERVATTFPNAPMFLSAGTPQQPPVEVTGSTAPSILKAEVLHSYRWLCEEVLKNHPLLHRAKILPQLHVLLWGNELGR